MRVWHSHLIASAGQDQAAKSYRLLRTILNTAVSDRLLTQNPCTVPGAGAENTPERPLLDTATVLDLADAIEPRLRALVLLAGFGALRPGELLGLERRDFDTLRGPVQVRRQAQEITGMGRMVTPPKSDAGTRTVAPEPVKPAETRSFHEICAGSFVTGLLIHAASGRSGGEGGLLTNRSGWAA